MLAVVSRVFDELTLAILQERDAAGDDPVENLVAGCEGYVTFGLRHPARYRVLFSDRGGMTTPGGTTASRSSSVRVVLPCSVRRRELCAPRGCARGLHRGRSIGERRRDG